jgi:hypothetical protein
MSSKGPVPVGAMQKVRSQLQAAKVKIAELEKRERDAQLALMQDHRFTVEASLLRLAMDEIKNNHSVETKGRVG